MDVREVIRKKTTHFRDKDFQNVSTYVVIRIDCNTFFLLNLVFPITYSFNRIHKKIRPHLCCTVYVSLNIVAFTKIVH